jgi:hypothetical protein
MHLERKTKVGGKALLSPTDKTKVGGKALFSSH